MKWFKRSFFILALALAFSATALAGETASHWANKHKEYKKLKKHNMSGGVPARIIKLEKRIAEMEAQLKALESLLALVKYVSVDEENTINNLMPPHVFLTGANLHIRSGTGQTSTTNGKGNLIIGYNEADEEVVEGVHYTHERTGSHNLVVGPEHSYSSNSGFVAGYGNTVSDSHASVSGGVANLASGGSASISGGHFNRATGILSSISGGVHNYATSTYATVSGGDENRATGWKSHVSGGLQNFASGIFSCVNGGKENEASGEYTTVGGGDNNVASGDESTVSGGNYNTAIGFESTVSGGSDNKASGIAATVSGGRLNEAGGDASSVSGGQNISCSINYGWAAGTSADTCP